MARRPARGPRQAPHRRRVVFIDSNVPMFDREVAMQDRLQDVGTGHQSLALRDQAAVERAKSTVLGQRRLSSRDALHIAVISLNGVDRIVSFDTGFDDVPGVTRLY